MRHILVACCLVPMLPGLAWSQAPAQVDGTYAGTASLQGATAKRCEQQFTFKLHVRGRAFTWTLPNKVEVQVPVAADGSFSAENGQRFLNGKIVGNTLTATTTGRGCGYAWSFTRE